MNKLYLIIVAVVIVVATAGTIIFLMIDRTSPTESEIAKASAEFKANQFRYELAKKLVPQLKIGMTSKDVEALLGTPNKRFDNDLIWWYTLDYSQFISVGFDPNGIVQKFGGAYAYLKSKENREK